MSEPKTRAGAALKAAMQGCWGYDEAPDGDGFDAYAKEVAQQLIDAATTVINSDLTGYTQGLLEEALTGFGLGPFRPYGSEEDEAS